jgi:Sel1 repeat
MNKYNGSNMSLIYKEIEINIKSQSMVKTYFYSIVIFAVFLISACGKETDPKKAFESGDYETALSLWMPLAENGDAEAQNYLGILYSLGMGVSRDYKKSLKWYERSAKAGYADAQRNYGDMINFGRGVPKDNFQAYKWYFAASQQGNKKAERQIAVIAASGNLSPNQQMHAKIEANEFILDESKRFMSHDTYINK